MRAPRTIALAALLLTLSLAGCQRGGATPESQAPARVVEDAAGRRVALPARVERVLPAGAPAALLLYTLAPETLVGWPRRPGPEAAPFVPKQHLDKPETGNLSSRGGGVNLEGALAARPDLLLDYGSLAGSYVSLADRVQAQTGVPYLLLDGSFEAIPAAYRMLGRVLDRTERAERLATYAEGVLRDMRAAAARTGDEGPRVYHARGDGLRTGSAGSLNTELLDFVGARNVVPAGAGLANVSLEDVLRWDPEHIVAVEDATLRVIAADPRWASLAAVREGRVHRVPSQPFGWLDRPPSVNRLLGVRWLLATLYPEEKARLAEQVDEFFRLYYQYEITAAERDALLAGRTAP